MFILNINIKLKNILTLVLKFFISSPTILIFLTKKIYKEYPRLKKKINILYAPTFRSDGSNNADELISNIDSDKYNLIISLHPKDIAKKDDKVICIDRKKYSTLDFIRVSDYVITDYSAVAIESCILNKKVIFYVYDYDYNKENGINIDLFKELPGCTFRNVKDMVNMLDNNKYNEQAFQKFRKKYVTNLNGGSTNKLIKLIEENL